MHTKWTLFPAATLAIALAACQPGATGSPPPPDAVTPTADFGSQPPIATSTPAAPADSSSAPTGSSSAPASPAASGPATTAGATPLASGDLPAAAFAILQPTPGGSTAIQGGATLFSAGGRTQVVIGVLPSDGETMAAAIQQGTCDNLTPEIAYRLTDVASGASSTEVSVDLTTLLGSPHAINIIVAGSETESSIACGAIQPLMMQ